jgi:predicted nucleic acid-binding protein
MPGLFVDTSGWGNILDRSQPYHQVATNLYRLARQNTQRIVTSNYILTELVALLTSPLQLSRPSIVAFIQSLKQSPYIQIVHIDQELDELAWQLLSDRIDKSWSLVDCSSFVLMERLKITESLTNDRHFEQAGFIRLLK